MKPDAIPVDTIVTTAVLHHLPDFWKFAGLKRLAQICRAGGKLYLFDVVSSFDMNDYESRLNQWVKATGEKVGPAFVWEVKTHIREEYSTFDWIMEDLLERAGFAIETADYANEFMAAYVCTRKG